MGSTIAVEVDSRTGKRVRGAVLDLICHPYPKKLLVLIPAHMSEHVAAQCQHILERFVDAARFRVVLLTGTGDSPAEAADAERVREVLLGLRPNEATARVEGTAPDPSLEPAESAIQPRASRLHCRRREGAKTGVAAGAPYHECLGRGTRC